MPGTLTAGVVAAPDGGPADVTIQPQARTIPAVRAGIARFRESFGVLAKRYSVSTETIRKWCKRGLVDWQDR